MGAKRKVTVDIEDVHQYLMYWYDSETFRDFNIMMDEGQTELAAYHIWNSGALDGSDPCPARDEAIRLAKRFDRLSRRSQDKVYDDTFKGARIHECTTATLMSLWIAGTVTCIQIRSLKRAVSVNLRP